MRHAFLCIALCLMSVVTTFAADRAAAPQSPAAKAAYEDVKKTLGLVPTFLKSYPEAGFAAAWDEMKSVQLSSTTALTGKEKELIGLGVSAQIPCKFCVYFHTEAARLNGATDGEIREALAMAAATRHWSTFLNGVQTDEDTFRSEADKIIGYVRDQAEAQKKGESVKPAAPIEVTSAETAYQDIEQTLGTVPTFMRQFPEAGLPGAWRMMKTVQLNPATELSGKTKELIGLGVSAQVPCKYCTYFHTEAAKLGGASERDIREAVAMASVTRFWSTMLNGSQTSESTFKREVAQIVRYLKAQSSASVTKRAKKQR